ncbi:uncharacterized protein LOC141527077 isoform X1 [Cotesia typhae]
MTKHGNLRGTENSYQPRRCYACDKIFCCVDCCEEHIKKKHSTRHTLTECPLCRREPLTVRNFDHEQLKNHVVFNHLPLQCLKCGELFEKHEDLKFIGTCDRHPIIRIEPPTLTELCVTSLSSSSLDLASSSGVTKTPSNSSIKRKSLSFSGDYQQFEDSPREFTRHTSTPMHVGFTKQLNLSNINNVSGKSGNFFFKALKRPVVPSISITSSSDKSINNNSSSINLNNFNSPEIIYKDNIKKSNLSITERTPLRSILSSKSFNKDSNNQSGSLFKNLSERRLEAMMELNDESDNNNNNKETPDSVGGSLHQEADSLQSSKNKKRRDSKDSNKRVRFSDEFNFKPEDDNLNDDNEKEEFFESCQSFSDTSISSTEKIQATSDNKFFGDENATKENLENIPQPGSSGSSSRVVVMVLLEKSGEIYPRDLAPIIDSSLEKLKTAITGSHAELVSANQRGIENCESGFTMLSVDSYTKVSTLECVKKTDSSSSYSSCLQKNQPAVKGNNTKGIFASVANAVKSVFKNISGSSKNTRAVEPNSPESILQDWSSIDSCESAITSLSRASKRPREEIEFLPSSSSSYSLDSSIDIRRGSTTKDDEDKKSTPNDIRSPVVKKARGWYKQIRPREPISRMKSSLSSTPLPRGVSLETQCFQQGALSTKDAILPLPDRAQVNRSTQTDF